MTGPRVPVRAGKLLFAAVKTRRSGLHEFFFPWPGHGDLELDKYLQTRTRRTALRSDGFLALALRK